MAMDNLPYPLTAQGPRPAHPLAGPARRTTWVVVLVGWLAMLGWSPEQVLAVLVALSAARGAEAQAWRQ